MIPARTIKIESLASRYTIPAKVQFSANLCLEEVLSNIFLHGYRERAKGVVTVRFARPRNAGNRLHMFFSEVSCHPAGKEGCG